MMVHRTAQMDKMKKIVVFDVLLVLGSGTRERFSSLEYLEARQIFPTPHSCIKCSINERCLFYGRIEIDLWR